MVGIRVVQEGTWYQQPQCAGFQSKVYHFLAPTIFQGVQNQSLTHKP
jgi:hypothetical protein